MKHFLYKLFSMFLVMGSVFGTEQREEKLLNQKGAIYSIANAYENHGPDHKPALFVDIDITPNTGTPSQERNVPALFAEKGWENNDQLAQAYRFGTPYLICNGEKVEYTRIYKKEEPVKYQFIEKQEEKKFKGNARVSNTDLFPGDKVSVCNLEIFERPDGTVLNKSSLLYEGEVMFYFDRKPIAAEELVSKPLNTPAEVAIFLVENEQTKVFKEILYPVTVAEITEPTFLFDFCREHGKEHQARKLGKVQMRHAYSIYEATPTTRVICAAIPPRQTIYSGPHEILLKERQDLREGLGIGKKNRPNCSTYNADTGLPANYRIIG